MLNYRAYLSAPQLLVQLLHYYDCPRLVIYAQQHTGTAAHTAEHTAEHSAAELPVQEPNAAVSTEPTAVSTEPTAAPSLPRWSAFSTFDSSLETSVRLKVMGSLTHWLKHFYQEVTLGLAG
jgi:hypothetical protein